MKPITRFSTWRRLEVLEAEARTRRSHSRDEAASPSKRDQVVAIVLNGSLSNEEAARRIEALGGPQSLSCITRIRELLDLARQRKAQGVQLT